MTLENRAAHRSTLCASSQAALSLEKSDPHFSVTYIQLSASGATIDNVMFARRDASEVRMASLPPQLTELKSIVGFRPIDLLTLSVGGNDMGFADCVIELLKRDDNEAHSALIGGKKLSDIKKDVDANLAKLPTRYANLNRWLSPFNIGRTIITEYPDPTRGDDGQTTTFAADYVNAFDVVPFIPGKLSLEIDKGEADFVVNNVLKPLNTHVASAAKANGWQFVTGIASDFRLHGYAASDHWFRTEDEASRRQGANMDMTSVIHYSTGGLHPNEQGHKAIASRLLQSMNQYVAGDLAVYTAAASSRTNIAYRGTDGHIHWRFRSGVSGAWQDTNITRMTGSRLAASGPAACIWDRDGSQHILYRGTDGNIYELYNKKNTLLWQSNNLTNATKADRAAAGSNPTAYAWDVDKSQHVIYVGIDRHVHELYFTVASGVWRHNDLTKVTGAALAEFSTPAGYTWSVDSSQHIAYISTDRHIHEMYFTRASGKWRDNDLGSLANDAIGAPAAYTRSVDDSQHIIYRSAANRICELWLSRRYPTWHRNDVVSTGTKYASNPVGYTWSVDNSQHIIYRSEDNHIHELWMSLKNPRWHDNDLGSLAADAVGNPAAYTWNVDNGQHIVYRASNGRIRELWLSKTNPRWHLGDLGMF
jgi:lysophospholipase L1-like esterase